MTEVISLNERINARRNSNKGNAVRLEDIEVSAPIQRDGKDDYPIFEGRIEAYTGTLRDSGRDSSMIEVTPRGFSNIEKVVVPVRLDHEVVGLNVKTYFDKTPIGRVYIVKVSDNEAHEFKYMTTL